MGAAAARCGGRGPGRSLQSAPVQWKSGGERRRRLHHYPELLPKASNCSGDQKRIKSLRSSSEPSCRGVAAVGTEQRASSLLPRRRRYLEQDAGSAANTHHSLTAHTSNHRRLTLRPARCVAAKKISTIRLAR